MSQPTRRRRDRGSGGADVREKGKAQTEQSQARAPLPVSLWAFVSVAAFLGAAVYLINPLLSLPPSPSANRPIIATDLVPYILGADFLACREYQQQQHHEETLRQHCCAAGVTLIPCEDGTLQKRLQLDIKARYDAVYQDLAQRANANESKAFGSDDELVGHVDKHTLQALRQRQEQTFVSTDADWKQRIRHTVPHYSQQFLRVAKHLRDQLAVLNTLPDDQQPLRDYNLTHALSQLSHANPVARFMDLSGRMHVPPQLQQALLVLFNATATPTLRDVYTVFPHLDPAHSTPELPSADDLLAPVMHTRRFMVPDEWIYFYSTMALKSCEVYTQEYVRGLALYLARRAGSPAAVVLEIAAGNGRLTDALNKELDGTLRVVASDIAGPTGAYVFPTPVARESHSASLARLRPRIVLCSWMPKDLDLSAAVRDTDSVVEYVLIGETDYGVSGEPRLTWGVPDADWTGDWERHDLHQLSALQIALRAGLSRGEGGGSSNE
ncbi:hypothetical protein RI367_004706 [Sorochytrium milnesiophthora]